MTSTLRLWFESLRNTVTNFRELGIFILLYALLLVSFYFFISTREATVWQVFVTYALLLIVPALFFVLQAAILEFARARKLALKKILSDALTLAVVTLPVVIVGALLWWLMNKLQARYPAPLAPFVVPPAPPKAPPTHWPTLLITSLRFVLFGVALPLATIHLWIEATTRDARESVAGGAKAIFSRVGNALARAFSSESVFVYGLGLILFVLGPYLILLPRLTFTGTKTAFTLFVAQVIVAFLLALVGWVVTLITLSKSATTAPEARQSVAPGVSPGNDAPSEVLSPL